MDKDTYFWTYWKKEKNNQDISKISINNQTLPLWYKLFAQQIGRQCVLTPILEPWRHLYICPESDRKSPHLKSSFVRNISAAGWMIKSKLILPTESVALRWLLPCFCNKTMESVCDLQYISVWSNNTSNTLTNERGAN